MISEVWNQGDFSNLPNLISGNYTIISDPGDPWDGQSIDLKTFEKRVCYTRNAFPDIHFQMDEFVEGDDVIVLRWTMTGTHLGDLPRLPATRKPFRITGMTFYILTNGQISGHRQNFDQLGFLAQIGVLQIATG